MIRVHVCKSVCLPGRTPRWKSKAWSTTALLCRTMRLPCLKEPASESLPFPLPSRSRNNRNPLASASLSSKEPCPVCQRTWPGNTITTAWERPSDESLRRHFSAAGLAEPPRSGPCAGGGISRPARIVISLPPRRSWPPCLPHSAFRIQHSAFRIPSHHCRCQSSSTSKAHRR